MEPTIDFDQLFALRVMLQDDFENESDIIKELKHELIQLGMIAENIPEFLKNFYEHFGINISLNTINESLNSNLNFMPMNFDLLNSLISNLNLSNNNTIESSISHESDDDHDILEDDLPPLEYNINNPIFINLSNSGFQSTVYNQQIEGIFNNLLHNIYVPPAPPPMEDVVVTLNEDELKSLKKYILDKNLDEKCSICMMGLEKEQEITELPCVHNFHSECIEPYLKEYNYKCPICREEVGKPKFDI